ncbi:MAG: hypothetical protein Q8R92_07215 [Deltaproteobacteria bacterium]|nr:hypothetical protein [Deltaproteobacteria bacterium]
MNPTLYLSNWSSYRTLGHHGPGRKLTIMAAPRSWEQGEGKVPALIPALVDLRAHREGAVDMFEYRRRYEQGLNINKLRPGVLYTTAAGGTFVTDGDTLCCACSRDVAFQGRCHRVFAAKALVQAGWHIILDGVEVLDAE